MIFFLFELLSSLFSSLTSNLSHGIFGLDDFETFNAKILEGELGIITFSKFCFRLIEEKPILDSDAGRPI